MPNFTFIAVTILTRQDEIPYVERCKGYEKCTELYFICDLDKQSQSGTGIEPDVESNQNSTLETRILSWSLFDIQWQMIAVCGNL